MKVMAKAKMVRISPRKVNLVADLVRGQSIENAQQILANTNKGATVTIGKVLDSAIANAENNLNLKRKDLVVESVLIGAGPTLKRIRPRSRGQANRILKRTSHITIILNDNKLQIEPAKPDVATTVKATPAEAKSASKKPAAKKSPAKTEEKK